MTKKKKEGKGRPSSYSDKISEKICLLISTTSQGLASICKSEDMPSTTTVYNWLNNDEHSNFLDMYTRAREAQADLLADQIISIADDQSNDTIINESTGAPQMNAEWVARCRLQVDARKWKASKLAPRKYGDRTQHDVTIQKDQPLFNDLE